MKKQAPPPTRTPQEIREAAGLDLATAATLSGVSRTTIERIEKRGDEVTLRILRLLAAAYGCTRLDLLAGIERVQAEQAAAARAS